LRDAAAKRHDLWCLSSPLAARAHPISECPRAIALQAALSSQIRAASFTCAFGEANRAESGARNVLTSWPTRWRKAVAAACRFGSWVAGEMRLSTAGLSPQCAQEPGAVPAGSCATWAAI
jgi:hypothetical protein